ncbi:hypothetical protein [Williamsia sp. CHRR-6]|uniref:hypothetical protein n=1 Tax=Williamsia sp. CHRR-6 TaxID=2835871 RepID=UPI001BD9B593|nr:hypothetical protein [Williamsia sp. CHRR-6]MBT0566240.1 hypothetical protein [Williamsia sp. CHRR-6]
MSDQTPPRPPRPAIAVTPMREPISDERPRIVDVALVTWAFTLITLLVTAALVGVKHAAVRAELIRSLAEDNRSTSGQDIRNTVDISLVASAGGAAIVLIVVSYGCYQVRDRVMAGRAVLSVMGVLTAAGAIGFGTVIAPARDAVNVAALVLPYVVAGLAVVATVLLHLGAVTAWLRAAPIRR